MDLQMLFNFVGGAGLLVGGWFCRTVYDAVRQLERELAQHKIDVAKSYVTNEELRRIEKKIDDGFQRMYDALSDKADK